MTARARWLVAVADGRDRHAADRRVLHEVATRGFTVVGLGAGVPVTLTAAVLSVSQQPATLLTANLTTQAPRSAFGPDPTRTTRPQEPP